MLEKKRVSVGKLAAEWTGTLATLKTVLERLELVSSLRDPRTGIYVHHGISHEVGNQTHCLLLKSHTDLFAEWQTMTLKEQMKDLKEFVGSPSANHYKALSRKSRASLILESWTQLESYRGLLPMSVSPLDRELFFTNLRSLIALLQAQLNGGRPTAGGSPPL